MATKTKTVRITRTWHVVVAPEYGDTDESIMAKALAEFDEQDVARTEPDGQIVNLMPDEAAM